MSNRNRHDFWKNKNAWVVGGSSGLGLDIARALAASQAAITIVGRDAGRLADARQSLLADGATSVATESIDVGRDDSLPQLKSLADGSDGIDLLVNAIGKSDRGYLSHLTGNDLAELFRINVITTLNGVNVCREALARSRGCIVNIGSLSSKVAPPGLGGYSIAKFGLAALSQQLRLELANEGIHTLLVCPGPLKRSDSGQRYRDLAQRRELPPELSRPGGGASLRLIEPGWLAEKILAAAADRQCELVVPSRVRWLAMLAQIWPRLADRFLRPKS